MSQTPAVSVVLPVYNGEAYLREAVESILAQTFGDFELIVINDGSKDGSGEILRELAARDPRVVLVERPNAGLVTTLNEGVARARAEFIARMDADDVARPERFGLQYARLVAEPQLGVLGSSIQIIDKVGGFIRQGDYPVTPAETLRFLEHGCPVAHPAVMMRRDAVLKAGGYRKVFSHCEDYDLWLRISELGYCIANLPQPLLNYRMHGANVSAVHREAQELGSIVARLAHRARKAGLPDPTYGVETIHARLIEAVPEYLRQDVDAAFFVLRHAHLSLAGREEIIAAWKQYLQLGSLAQRETIMCDFLMRLLNGAVRNRDGSLAMRAFSEALRLHPRASSELLWRKLKAAVSARY
ncbi:glycosyltransferase family 2 protein [Dechloromonas hortensis]|uniref:glycosyltransferase family 2 protein n=1 Tax=Dechloromonas hortensis TaxID=337779 RepID=UPI00129258EE|nr:glycosyltransferase [Dechloromonas hortensis]